MAISESLGLAKRVELPQGILEYRDTEGAGEPVLLLHGLGNGDIWRNVVPRLSQQGCRCITPDLPFGSHATPLNPDADVTVPGVVQLVVDFARSIGVESAVVLTNDAAGVIAQMLTTTHPGLIDRLILTASDNHRQFVPRYFKPLRMACRISGQGDLILRVVAFRPVQELFFRSVARAHIPDEIRESYVRPMITSADVRRDLLKFFLDAKPQYTLTAARHLGAFLRPVLVVWGQDELWLTRRGGRRLSRAFPNSRFEVLPGSRSFVPEDAPDELADLVLDFIGRPAQSTPDPSQGTSAMTAAVMCEDSL